MDRFAYQPVDEKSVVYHYCSPDTLLAILKSRSIRLSDVSCMNDSKELLWGLGALEETLSIGESYESQKDRLSEVFSQYMSSVKVLAACFSTHSDMLSQWRAYGSDGSGFAIGFSGAEICSLPGSTVQICYDPAEQKEMWQAGLAHAFTASQRDGKLDQSDFLRQFILLMLDLASMKNPAFSEEGEVRLVHPVLVETREGISMMKYPAREKFHAPEIQFQMRGSTPAAFVDLPFTSGTQPIREIVIGPRAEVAERSIAMLLGNLGYGPITVRKSAASYR
ncbi:DUF2971 domain-containing protein [Stenotrophomonas rhizophila]|uniref:DUF2971 domain-containing protein n=1 Tax=Stenotrophomonas rhizophila TaxID=216778 RepID=UPI001AEBAC27|nr:DUF2971 domain-containing protein [Stenotrophomonas rhizophila]